MNLQPWMIPSDLAPGDAKSLARDWSDVELHRIESSDDPHFDTAFGALWSQFQPWLMNVANTSNALVMESVSADELP